MGKDYFMKRIWLYLKEYKKECIDCEVAEGCAWCQGENYDAADTPTIYQRAIENECYVAIAGSVGNLPRVHNMDIQYAQSAVLRSL